MKLGKTLAFTVPLALFAALALLLGAGLNRDPRAVPSPLLGRPAPPFVLPRLDDPQRVLRADELRGRAYVLNVWASWCVACRDEHPLLVDFARRNAVPVVGLNYKDRRDDAIAWLARFGDPYRASMLDADGRVGIDFGVVGVPETFVVDGAGVVRLKHTGALTPEVLRGRIEPLLRELDG
jgi:cytochrome c biogenesis protein CcmG/thiol:disulfide interchange protein DsbE